MAVARTKRYSLNLAKYYRNTSTQVSLTVVLSLLLMAFFVMVALRPTFVTIGRLNTQIEETEQTLSNLQKKSRSLQQAAQVWERVQEGLPFVEASIPSDSVLYQAIVKTLETIAAESGVEIANSALGEALIHSQVTDVFAGDKRSVVEMEAGIRIKGDFLASLRFLRALLQMDRLVSVESVTVTKELEEAGGVQIGMTVTGKVHYVADKARLNKILGVETK